MDLGTGTERMGDCSPLIRSRNWQAKWTSMNRALKMNVYHATMPRALQDESRVGSYHWSAALVGCKHARSLELPQCYYGLLSWLITHITCKKVNVGQRRRKDIPIYQYLAWNGHVLAKHDQLIPSCFTSMKKPETRQPWSVSCRSEICIDRTSLQSQ